MSWVHMKGTKKINVAESTRHEEWVKVVEEAVGGLSLITRRSNVRVQDEQASDARQVPFLE
jgi:hypothetical protein